MGLIFVDVEATGLSPANGVMAEFGAVDYKSRQTFHGVIHKSHPDPDNPAKPVIDEMATLDHERQVMRDFEAWISGLSKSRAVFMSDNPAYDFQWINFYFDKWLGTNPFGHSGRRISDFWAGLQGDFYNTQQWKQYRKTEHDHNPVNDAMGNVEAFGTILELAKSAPRKETLNDQTYKHRY